MHDHIQASGVVIITYMCATELLKWLQIRPLLLLQYVFMLIMDSSIIWSISILHCYIRSTLLLVVSFINTISVVAGFLGKSAITGRKRWDLRGTGVKKTLGCDPWRNAWSRAVAKTSNGWTQPRFCVVLSELNSLYITPSGYPSQSLGMYAYGAPLAQIIARSPFYLHGLTLIPTWISNAPIKMCGIKSLIHSQISSVAPLKFSNGYVI